MRRLAADFPRATLCVIGPASAAGLGEEPGASARVLGWLTGPEKGNRKRGTHKRLPLSNLLVTFRAITIFKLQKQWLHKRLRKGYRNHAKYKTKVQVLHHAPVGKKAAFIVARGVPPA